MSSQQNVNTDSVNGLALNSWQAITCSSSDHWPGFNELTHHSSEMKENSHLDNRDLFH